ncbi:MAG: DNA polymerase III subunit delta [Pseudomonadota bacterium]
MKASGSSVATFLKAPDPKIWCALVFCEDDGVASDAAHTLFTAWGAGKPTERLVLTENDISKSPAHFMDTLEARSLLGDRRILTIKLSNEKLARHIISAIEAGESTPDRFDTRLIIVMGGLKKTSKLRKTVESATMAIALQLFEDSEADIEARVRAALASDGVSISDEALTLFIHGLPNDRRLVRAEVEKLGLYGLDLSRTLEPADIEQISASGTDAAQTALVNHALRGQTSSALSELERLETAGTSPISLLRAFQREAERLLAAHAQGVSDANAAMRLRPPVWRDHWPAFRDTLRYWSPTMILRLLTRIHDCEANAKQSGAMAAPATRHLITDIVRIAAAAAETRA